MKRLAGILALGIAVIWTPQITEAVEERFEPEITTAISLFPSSCSKTINLTNHPDTVTVRCLRGTGSFRLVFYCYFYDGGPYYVHRTPWVTVASGMRSSGQCTTQHPLIDTGRLQLQRRSY